MLSRLLGVAGLLAGLCLAASAEAATVTFDDIVIPPNPYGWAQNQFSHGGLTFKDDSFTIAPTTFSLPTPTSSQFMEVGSSIAEPLTITATDGNPFDLNSLWMGLGDWNDQSKAGYDLVTITGYAGDCAVSCTETAQVQVQIGYNWTIFDLTGFTGLSSVTISQPIYTVGGAPAIDPNTGTTTDYGWEAFDNINYTPDVPGASGPAGQVGFTSTVVPEPACWALLITGFGLAGAALRRRRTAARA